ncbi:CehA/McbA family metallohydrolase [Clostridium paridis]|uniref:CehA/McbA family metallohydrolase n=1 Tax=Clostridium paridis TaxID=2803863 RepID=A0A937K3X6_9CLOT|nr:CehA/McbA family metallohydrolase [Clostridium paridis]MBL4932067.1 CehA/McbA family metallohydrolase [Clostridium paridis]
MTRKESTFKYKSEKIDDKDINFYYGIPHCHTFLSNGRGSPIEALEYGYKNSLDFMFITDHNSYLKEDIDYKSSKVSKWTYLKSCLKKYNKKHNRPLTLLGFESRSNPWGDLNFINISTYFTGVVKDLRVLLLWMLNNQEGLIFINHPHSPIERLPYNAYLNYFITSVEVGNGSPPHKYIRHHKHYFKLLDNGWKLGAINGQDNHRLNFGDTDNLTCVICNELNHSSLVDSIRCRRTYSTESRTLKAYFSMNGYFMGEVISHPNLDELKFYIFLQDPKYKIKKVEIISNNGIVVKTLNDLNLNTVKYFINLPVNPGNTWYLLEVYQEEDKIAITSPIFFEY